VNAFFRWQLKNTDAPGCRLFFRGRGIDLLWRGLVAFIAALVILPIPWVVAWLTRWFIGNVEALRVEVAAAVPQPAVDAST
jgi:hypothetical protein